MRREFTTTVVESAIDGRQGRRPDSRYNPNMSIVLNWNGQDLPDEVRELMPVELRELPRGRYVLEPVDEVPELSDEEEAGIHAAIESVRAGKAVTLEAVKTRVDRILGP